MLLEAKSCENFDRIAEQIDSSPIG